MKHFLLLALITCALNGYGQVVDTAIIRHFKGLSTGVAIAKDNFYLHEVGLPCACVKCKEKAKPDTLRCTLIVYYSGGNSILHTKNGFMVTRAGKDNIYLDDRKRVVKNVEVLTFKLK